MILLKIGLLLIFRLQPDPLNNPPISKLGFDLLNDLPPVEELQALLSKGARNIKTLLLDQVN